MSKIITIDSSFINKYKLTVDGVTKFYLNDTHNNHTFIINFEGDLTIDLRSLTNKNLIIFFISTVNYNLSFVGDSNINSYYNSQQISNQSTVNYLPTLYGYIRLLSYQDPGIRFVITHLRDNSFDNQVNNTIVGQRLLSGYSTFGNLEIDNSLTISNNHGQEIVFPRQKTFDNLKISSNDITKHARNNTISAGFTHTAILSLDGAPYTLGSNNLGELGLGDSNNRSEPTLIQDANYTDIEHISCGGQHTSFRLQDKTYTFGYNIYGQLGLGHNDDVNIPTKVSINNIVSVKCGSATTGFISSTGRVYMCGSNFSGELGLGDIDTINVPTLIPNLYNVIDISLSEATSLFLTSNGRVYSCGYNFYGQLGLGDNVDRNVPTLIPYLNNIIEVSCGEGHTLFLKSNGTVYSVGRNRLGILGLGSISEPSIIIPTLIPNINNIIAISSSDNYNALLTNSGEVYTFGWNAYGNLGLGDTSTRYIPTLIPNLYNVISISLGFSHIIFLTSTKKIYVVGDNSYGQLGFSNVTSINKPALLNTNFEPKIYKNEYDLASNKLTKFPYIKLGYSKSNYESMLSFSSVSGSQSISFNLENDPSESLGTNNSRFSIGYSGQELSFNKLQPNSYIKFNDLSNYNGNSELCIYKGNVGIGNLAVVSSNLGAIPLAKMHIVQSNDGDHVVSFSGKIGDAIILENTSSQQWKIGVTDSIIPHLVFANNDDGGGGYLNGSSNVSNIDFTGQHRSLANKNIDNNFLGLIVSSTGSYVNLDNSLEPHINESLPVCKISNIDYDKTVFGVISDKEDTNRNYNSGVWVSIYKKINVNENRLIVNSLGEGGIWICNKNGPLLNGDCITSSSVPGYGMKQIIDDGELQQYTVAKITCDCNFYLTKIVKQKLVVSNNNIVYSDSGDLQYEDDLDSEGNQQYVYKYETRFLDSQGNLLVDENDYNDRLTNEEEVYLACFVGCTYHCG